MAWEGEDLLQRAAGYLETFQFDLAAKFCQRVLDADAQNLEALELMAAIKMEMGMIREAYDLLYQCVQLSPEQGYQKYLAMGQLCRGRDAVSCYQQGIKLMQGERPEDEMELSLQRQQECSAWCSIVEVFMTDLCDEEEAEQESEAALHQALAACQHSVEAYRTMADLRLVQQRTEEAKEALHQAMQLIRSMDRESPLYPSYDQRSVLARLLIETERPADAMELLEGLMAEDDEVIDTWYLTGVAASALGDREAVVEAFSTALRLMKKLGEDAEQLESMRSIMQSLAIRETELDLSDDE